MVTTINIIMVTEITIIPTTIASQRKCGVPKTMRNVKRCVMKPRRLKAVSAVKRTRPSKSDLLSTSLLQILSIRSLASSGNICSTT